jgi:hypothetical protein
LKLKNKNKILNCEIKIKYFIIEFNIEIGTILPSKYSSYFIEEFVIEFLKKNSETLIKYLQNNTIDYIIYFQYFSSQVDRTQRQINNDFFSKLKYFSTEFDLIDIYDIIMVYIVLKYLINNI